MAIRDTQPKKAKVKEEFTYTVIEECGTIGTRGAVEVKLRYMQWNDNPPTYDLRPWKIKADGTEQQLKGITLSGSELLALGNLIMSMKGEEE